MGKEIVVINPEEIEKKLVEKPSKPGQSVIDLTLPIEIDGATSDQVVMRSTTPLGKTTNIKVS